MTAQHTQKSNAGRSAAPLDAVAIRNQIAARLMRLDCQRRGGCTRSCRRQQRCVVADAVERESTAG